MKWCKCKKPTVIELEMVRVEPLTGIEKMEAERQAKEEMQQREAREKHDAELRREIAKIRERIAPHLRVIASLEAQLSTRLPFDYAQAQMNAVYQQQQYMGISNTGLGNLFGGLLGGLGGMGGATGGYR